MKIKISSKNTSKQAKTHPRKETGKLNISLSDNLKKHNAKRKKQNKINDLRKAGKLAYRKRTGIKDNLLPKGVSSRIDRNCMGVPLARPPRHTKILGSLAVPDTEGKAYLEKEKNLGQVEILMLKGIVTVNTISKQLKMNYATAKKYVEQVHYRWAILGGSTRMIQVKGEAKQRLNLINEELWKMHQATKDNKIKGMCLTQLIQVHDRKLILEGITPKTIPLIASPEGSLLDGNLDDRIKDHSEMVRLASALLTFTGDKKPRKKPTLIEDAEFEEVAE